MKLDELNTLIASLREWEDIAAEANAQVESIKDQLKAELTKRNVDQLDTGKHVIRWTTVKSSRFDSTAFKSKYENLWKEYLKQIISKRFTISK